MKNQSDSKKYYTTSEAAKILAVSLTTVQRMVEQGFFKAFVTKGGHRRIWASSLNEYSREIGIEITVDEANSPQLCILHSSQHIQEELVKISHLPRVKLITDPLDLMGLSKQVGSFFVDVRIPWLTQSPLNLQNHIGVNAIIVAYNVAGLPKNSPWRNNPTLTVLDRDISEDFVRGFMLSASLK